MKNYDFTKVKDNLEKLGYAVTVFENKGAAADYLNSQINGKTVGLGGSVTIRETGIFPMLSARNVVYWHDAKPEGLSVAETRLAGARAQIYISSVNGLSENGEIVNIDNTGNRVAAVTYGPEKVYLLIGGNKLAPDLEKAIDRARNIAAPKNAQRLHRKTPCAVKGDRCYDCDSPDRICRNLSVFWKKPTGAAYEILLIDENLGY